MEIIDGVIPEPLGGAHRDPQAMAANIKEVILKTLKELKEESAPDLLKSRYKKFRGMGVFA
jgi:acetyl-CoA carboxylase carboxyl transferase subunit alpha